MADPSTTAENFINHYYQVFDTNLESIKDFYRDSSTFTFHKTVIQGRERIVNKLEDLPIESIIHEVDTIDAQLTTGGKNIFVLVTGRITANNDTPKVFTEAFLLSPEGDNYFIANEVVKYVSE